MVGAVWCAAHGVAQDSCLVLTQVATLEGLVAYSLPSAMEHTCPALSQQTGLCSSRSWDQPGQQQRVLLLPGSQGAGWFDAPPTAQIWEDRQYAAAAPKPFSALTDEVLRYKGTGPRLYSSRAGGKIPAHPRRARGTPGETGPTTSFPLTCALRQWKCCWVSRPGLGQGWEPMGSPAKGDTAPVPILARPQARAAGGQRPGDHAPGSLAAAAPACREEAGSSECRLPLDGSVLRLHRAVRTWKEQGARCSMCSEERGFCSPAERVWADARAGREVAWSCLANQPPHALWLQRIAAASPFQG